MKLLRLIKKDLIKIFTNAGLLIGIGLGVALVLFANIYTDGTGKGYYTITALSTFSKSEMIDNGMYSENLMSMILIQVVRMPVILKETTLVATSSIRTLLLKLLRQTLRTAVSQAQNGLTHVLMYARLS